MKLAPLVIVGALVLAAPALAYVQSSDPNLERSGSTNSQGGHRYHGPQNKDWEPEGNDDHNGAVPAVPEPGTMTMAAMGLAAVAAAVRRRQSK